jgi:hypothetical protein
MDWLTQEDISLKRSFTLITGLSGEINGKLLEESLSLGTPFSSSVLFSFLFSRLKERVNAEE